MTRRAQKNSAGSSGPRLSVPAGAIVIMPDATVWRMLEDGTTEELLPPGHPRPGCAHSTARQP